MPKRVVPVVLILGLSTLIGCRMQGLPLQTSASTIKIYPSFGHNAQALVDPYSVSSIATLSIIPYRENTPGQYLPLSSVTGNTTDESDPNILKLSQTTPIDPNRPFVLRGLKPNQKYRIYGRAYGSAGTQISKDAQSLVDLTVGNDDSLTAQLPVVLMDTPFAASTTAVITSFPAPCDYFKLKLYQGQTLISQSQSSNPTPHLNLGGLQGNTTYRLEAEAYKAGSCISTGSLSIPITNETVPATVSLTLEVPYIVSLFAGDGTGGYLDGKPAQFNYPVGIAFDGNGDLLVGDCTNRRIRKVNPLGVVSTFAGDGVQGHLDGTGTSARFQTPHSFAFDAAGNIYVADYWDYCIRKVTPAGVVTTLAGDGTAGYQDGPGNTARFGNPSEIAIAPDGNFYVSDCVNNCIRKVTPAGVVSTFAGSTTPGFVDAAGTLARFRIPSSPVIDAQGNIYVSDAANNAIRKITPAGVVTTLVGNGTAAFADGDLAQGRLSAPQGLALDAKGNLYVVEQTNRRVRVISNGQIRTVAGDGIAGLVDGTGTATRFSALRGIAIDRAGYIYVSDCGNHTIRKLR